MADDSQVMEADLRFFRALTGADSQSLTDLLTDDFLLLDLTGAVISKAALVSTMSSGTLTFDSIEPIESHVRFYGSAAVVTGRTRMKGRLGESSFEVDSRYTHVFVSQNDAWRLASAQGTPVASP